MPLERRRCEEKQEVRGGREGEKILVKRHYKTSCFLPCLPASYL